MAERMSRYRTAKDAESATKPKVRRNSQRRPKGSRTTRTDSVPVTAAATIAAAVVTAQAGSDAMMPAIGKAKRGHGVKRTSMMFVINDAVPIVIDAWKKAQALSPTRAKTE